MAGSPLSNRIKETQGMMLTTITTDIAIGDHWEVQYSRFFNYPSLSSFAAAGGHHPSLVPLSNKSRKGSWLSSFNSSAYLKLLNTSTDHSDASRSIVLTVTLDDSVIEEHYVSKLHFTWPQVSCLSGYPPRGSRVVFMSYKDHVGQIQKFAVQFLTNYESERFINFLKENLGQESLPGHESGISISKPSSQSEIFPSIEPAYRPTQDWGPITSSADDSQPMYRLTQDWSPVASSADTSIQQMNPSGNQEASNSNCLEASLETTITQNVQEKLSGFPPSFTSLLMNCRPMAEQAQSTVCEEVTLKKEIAKYLEDSSFQDMLSKVQKVINEFGDDLLL